MRITEISIRHTTTFSDYPLVLVEAVLDGFIEITLTAKQIDIILHRHKIKFRASDSLETKAKRLLNLELTP